MKTGAGRRATCIPGKPDPLSAMSGWHSSPVRLQNVLQFLQIGASTGIGLAVVRSTRAKIRPRRRPQHAFA